MVREKETLEEALKFCQLTKRPKKLEEGDDKMLFQRLLSLLDECDDVQHVFHNVEGL